MVFHPTYDQYKSILLDVIKTGKCCDYSEAAKRSKFIVLRHDIEFSVERAYSMAKLETEMGVQSSYFVQIRNDAYNALSVSNTSKLQEMFRSGHKIGLHYHLGESLNPLIVKNEIAEQCKLLEQMLQIPIDRYSMHRPQKETEYYATSIPSLINAYAADYFTFSDDVNEKTQLSVKYISDAKYQWNYGEPDYDTLTATDKIQLLIHPDYWSEDEANLCLNFTTLIKEHKKEFVEIIDNECKQFRAVKEQVQKLIYI